MAATNGRGYGVIGFGGQGKVVLATHAAFFLRHGEWPMKFVLHSCDNPSCVNHEHLRQGTAKENTADMLSRGRQRKPRCH